MNTFHTTVSNCPPSNIPISENSDLDLLCFKPEENENMSEAFIASIKDS